MTKYSIDLKIEIVQKYINEGFGYKRLSNEFQISTSNIKYWVYIVKEHGYEGLNKIKKVHQSTEFKIDVINFILKNNSGVLKTAAHFLISPTSVKRWFNIHQNQGIVGLIQLEKRPNMPGKRKQNFDDKDKKIKDLEKELQKVKMERDILKKFNAVAQKLEKKNSK